MTTIPFQYCGHKFLSRITAKSTASKMIKLGQLTEARFIEFNIECLSKLWGAIDQVTEAEIRERVEYINAGGTTMMLEYVGKA
jgi:hypothetical protein